MSARSGLWAWNSLWLAMAGAVFLGTCALDAVAQDVDTMAPVLTALPIPPGGWSEWTIPGALVTFGGSLVTFGRSLVAAAQALAKWRPVVTVVHREDGDDTGARRLRATERAQ